jgi:hypothetical protein
MGPSATCPVCQQKIYGPDAFAVILALVHHMVGEHHCPSRCSCTTVDQCPLGRQGRGCTADELRDALNRRQGY